MVVTRPLLNRISFAQEEKYAVLPASEWEASKLQQRYVVECPGSSEAMYTTSPHHSPLRHSSGMSTIIDANVSSDLNGHTGKNTLPNRGGTTAEQP